jgi:hypothetical protein
MLRIAAIDARRYLIPNELTATVVAVIELAAVSAIAAYAANAPFQRKPLRATAFLPFGLFLAPAIGSAASWT